MFRSLLAILLVSTFSGCHGAPRLQQPTIGPLSELLNDLSSKCQNQNAELVDLIQSQLENCKVFIPPYTKSQYECMMFYDINKKLCVTNLTLQPGNFTKRLNMNVTADDLCEQAKNWPVSDLIELPIYKKSLEAVLKNKEVCAAKLCGVEDMLSQDANYFCKYYKLGIDILNGAITDTPKDASQLNLHQGTGNNLYKIPGPTGNEFKDIEVKKKVASNGEIVQAENLNEANIQDIHKTLETADGNSNLVVNAQGVGQNPLHHEDNIANHNVRGSLNKISANYLAKKQEASSNNVNTPDVGPEETGNEINSVEHRKQLTEKTATDAKKINVQDAQESLGNIPENPNQPDQTEEKPDLQHKTSKTDQSKDVDDHNNVDAAASQNNAKAKQEESGHKLLSTETGSKLEHEDNLPSGQILQPPVNFNKQQGKPVKDKQEELETNPNKQEKAADQVDEDTLDGNVEPINYQDDSDGVVDDSLDKLGNIAGKPSSGSSQHQQNRDPSAVDDALDGPVDEEDKPSVNTGRHQSIDSFIVPGQIGEVEDDHFFTLFTTCIIMVVLLYVLYHNKSKVMGLIVEGRRTNRRRNSRGHSYKRLDTLEQAMTSGPAAPPSKMIY